MVVLYQVWTSLDERFLWKLQLSGPFWTEQTYSIQYVQRFKEHKHQERNKLLRITSNIGLLIWATRAVRVDLCPRCSNPDDAWQSYCASSLCTQFLLQFNVHLQQQSGFTDNSRDGEAASAEAGARKADHQKTDVIRDGFIIIIIYILYKQVGNNWKHVLYSSFFKVATLCSDYCFAHSWHSLDELQQSWRNSQRCLALDGKKSKGGYFEESKI